MKKAVLLFATVLLCGCAGELTTEIAMRKIEDCQEFNVPFYAPFNTGAENLTGENYKNPENYIRTNYGKLIDAGLITATVEDGNSWRKSLIIKLTYKGEEFVERNRSGEESLCVRVCRAKPLAIDSLIVIRENKEVEVWYTIVEDNVTLFGEYLGFVEGKPHTDRRRFIKKGFGWQIAD